MLWAYSVVAYGGVYLYSVKCYCQSYDVGKYWRGVVRGMWRAIGFMFIQPLEYF